MPLFRYRHVFIAPRGRPGGSVDEILFSHGKQREIALALPHFLVAPHVVTTTDYVLTLARRVAREFAKLYPITVLPTPVPVPSFPIALVWHARTDHDPVMAWLRREIGLVSSEIAKELPVENHLDKVLVVEAQ